MSVLIVFNSFQMAVRILIIHKAVFSIALLSAVTFCYADSSDLECEVETYQFYESLLKLVDRRDLKGALSRIKKQSSYISTDDERAAIARVSGDVYRASYINTGNEAVAKAAEKLYYNALEFEPKDKGAIYLRLALLMKNKKNFNSATKYMNLALSFESQSEGPIIYLGTALQIAAGSKDWESARKIVGYLYNRKNDYFFNTIYLLPSVQAFCISKEIDKAEKFIQLIVEYDVNLTETQKKYFEGAKSALKKCKLEDEPNRIKQNTQLKPH